MRRIEILGPGCPRCEQLAATTRLAADQLGIEYELSKVTDVTAFPAYGLMMTPGLVMDGELKAQGKVPSVDEIKDMLS